MKALSSASPQKRSARKVSKPLMEKRRRERINHSLEKLRLLMMENSHDESMKNPKVGKAEILESVVHFLNTEKKDSGNDPRAAMKPQPTDQSAACVSGDSYRGGVRSCLLRVSHFIASKSQELMEASGGAAQAPLARPVAQSHPSPGPPTHRPLLPAPVGDPAPAPLSPQSLLHHDGIGHPYLTQVSRLQCDPRGTFASTSTAPVPPTDPVWRPWPL